VIDSMPKPRPPHLWRVRTRHGRMVWYVCTERGGKRVRINHEYGTPEFEAAYQQAINGTAPQPHKGAAAAGSLAWLVERYRETTDWTDLSPATRRNRENHFKAVIKTAGHHPYRAINQTAVVAGKDRRAQTPAQARNYLDAMRGLFRWAKSAQLITIDPTDGVKNPKRKKGEGFPAWTEEDIEKFYARWPLGTKERVWIDVLLFTGGRRGDAVVIGRQHVRDGIATFRTEKSQGAMPVTIPILPVLQRTLDAGPTGDLAFICGKKGRPFTKESFGNEFKRACVAAGISNKSAHGCRKAGATRAAENGATVPELNAIFGWTGTAMASLYTQAADRKRLARQAMDKLSANETATSIHAPDKKVRVRNPKP
jgi:integrase